MNIVHLFNWVSFVLINWRKSELVMFQHFKTKILFDVSPSPKQTNFVRGIYYLMPQFSLFSPGLPVSFESFLRISSLLRISFHNPLRMTCPTILVLSRSRSSSRILILIFFCHLVFKFVCGNVFSSPSHEKTAELYAHQWTPYNGFSEHCSSTISPHG